MDIIKPQFHGISNRMAKSGCMAYDDLFVCFVCFMICKAITFGVEVL